MRKPFALSSASAVAIIACLSVAIFSGHSPSQAADDRKPPLTQPDYQAYQMVTPGMDESEVIQLLGEPIAKPGEKKFNRNTDVVYPWEYGQILRKCLPFPKPPMFRVLFLRGKVFSSEDPFQGQFSKDGRPTTPRPLWPEKPPLYHFYPRYIDFRWSASSGQYPMLYEIEVGAFTGGNQGDDASWNTVSIQSDIPYLAHEFVGDQLGRWRVRAVNSHGASSWSAYSTFEFDNGPNGMRVGHPQ